MQKNTPSKGTFVALIIIVVVALGLYFYFQGNPSTDATSSLDTPASPESVQAQEDGARVLSLLNEIKSLQIDDSIFRSAVYKSLVDYSIQIPEQSVGRSNPFAPIGR